jgi:hypothetical protein
LINFANNSCFIKKLFIFEQNQDNMNYFPIIDDNNPKTLSFATITSIVALCFGAFAGLFVFGPPNELNSTFLRIFFTIVDPYALQLLAIGHCCVCLTFYSNSKQPYFRSKFILNSMISIAILALLFICFYLINDLVFKKSFNRPRPDFIFGNNVGFLSRLSNNVGKEGAPSGFASRGVFLLLTATLAGFQVKSKKGFLSIFTNPAIILIIQFVFLFLCSWARVGVGFHYWFDILVGISLGTFIFWFFNIIYKWSLLSYPLEDFTPYSAILVCIILGFVIIGFFYSRDATMWAPAVLSIILVTVIIDIYKIFRKYFKRPKHS